MARRQRDDNAYRDTLSASASGATLVSLFEAQAARTPHKNAVVAGDARLRYAELDRAASRLAWQLIGADAKPESVVGLLLDHSVDSVTAILGVLKSGAAYLPLDPEHPAERLRYVLGDATPDIVLTTAALAGRLADSRVRVIRIDQLERRAEFTQLPSHAPGNPERNGTLLPDHPAYIIYTSGSTGRPKGVTNTHRNVVRLFDATRRHVDFDEDSIWALFHSLAFDFSVWELWGALLHGGSVAIVPREIARSARDLSGFLVEHGVTILNQTPSAFFSLLERPGALRKIIFGGEALDLPGLAPWFEQYGDVEPELINMYGITETTVHATCAPLRNCHAAPGNAGLIGTPLDDLDVYVLDERLEPAAVGNTGELYVAGPGLARGYWRRGAMTAERFVADPHRPGERMYRSGDLAARRADGSLVYRGRVDEQIKIRGYRIEPAEIESALIAHPDVSRVAVVARENHLGETILVAYVVANVRHSQQAFRAWLSERLPDYMLPTSYVALDALPLTANGKLDRDSLPVPQDAGMHARYIAPETRAAVQLCALVAELLDVERVGLGDHFFHLGGHSLSATQLCARLRADLRLDLPIQAVFETPVMRELAAALERLTPASGLALAAGPRPERLPLSFPQARLWFLDQLEGGSPGYSIPIVLRLSGPLDARVLEQAFSDVIGRHESLRTLLVEDGGEPWQQIVDAADAHFALERRRVSSTDLEASIAGFVWNAFVLDRDLPIRAVLLRHDVAVHVLVIVVHHTAADGWSIRPLLADLSRAYAARRRGAVPAFDPLPVQYADYVLWTREYAARGTLARHAVYWQGQLEGLPEELALPYDRPRTPDAPAGRIAFTLPAELHRQLIALSLDADTTLFMTLQTALAALLSRLGAGNDIPLGTAIAGRAEAVLEPLVGFFVNTLVLRNDTTGDPTFLELIERARSTCLAAYAHQDLPFERLVEQLEPARRRGRQPLFQTMLVLHNTPPFALELDGVEATAISVPSTTAKFDLSWSFVERRDTDGCAAGLEAELEYNASLFEAATTEALVARYRRLLEHIVDHPECRLATLPLLDDAERRRLVEGFSQGESGSNAVDVIARFEAQAQAAPDTAALKFDGRAVCYQELDAVSNRLARQLLGAGVGAERIVATELPRSVELVVAILGILKAGAVWLPLAPGMPPARRRHVLEDAQPVAVLGTGDGVALDGHGPALHIPALDVRALIDDDTRSLGPIAYEERTAPMWPQHAAYVLYTSGSTGMPKGVMISRGSLARYVGQVIGVLGEDSADMALLTPVVFDLSLTTIFAPLVTGGTLRLMPEDDTAAALASALQGTAVKLTPSHVALLAELPFETGRLETAILGGEALTAAHVETLRQRCPGVRIFNEYGPTEATVGVTAAVVDEPADITIGRPYPGVHAYVLDERLRPCPVNVAGELYLAGPSLARGYLNRPGLTAVHFIASPYRPGERLYRTGDLAAWRSDGELRCYGRNDEQIKLRGHRIEPAEIESTLARHPDVVNAVVIADKASNGETRLVAYVVSRAEFDTETLRAHLAMRLPDVFIPAVFVAVDALPLTPNGKLDRAALPVAADAGMSSNHGAPTSEDEQLLCELVAELLGVDRVGVDDHFFHLGGHSLLATRFVARIQEQTGKTLPLRAVFETPRLGDLAARLAMLGMPAPATALGADADQAHVPFPLTPVQSAYWLGRQDLVALGRVACHAYSEYRLRALDAEAMPRAWQATIDHHPMLRTIIDDDATQRVLDQPAEFTIAVVDVRGDDDPEARVEAIRQTMARTCQAAHRWPLFDVRVTRVADDDWRLHLRIDAMILDGESTSLLLAEVFDRLHCRYEETARALHTFRDYVLHVHGDAQAAARDAAREYWASRLDDLPPAPVLPLAVDPTRLEDPHFSRRQALLDIDTWRRLTQRARYNGLTPSTVLLTAYAEIIGTWARHDDFTLNLTVGDRRLLHGDIATMLGVFTNLTPLAVHRSRVGAFVDRATALQQQLACDLDHRDFTGVDVQRLIAQRAGDPHAGLLPVVFTSLLGERVADLSDDAELVYSITETPQTWLDNKVYEQGGILTIDWDAPEALFPPGLLDAMFEAYVGLLRALATDDAAWTDARRSLVPASEQRLIAAVNDTTTDLEHARTLLHDPVFAAMRVYPDAIAVIGDEQALTYRELEARSLALAQALGRVLSNEDVLVAIVMEKGVEQIIASLAVLETGRAFLPISAGQPDARIQTILAQSGARVAVIQARLQRDRDWQQRVTIVEVPDSVPVVAPSRLAPRHTPDDIAYVIYTSGSTGQPKGVAIQHCAARNTLDDLERRFDIQRNDRVLWVSSLEFDLSIFDLFGVLGAGGAVVVPPLDGHQNPRAWARAVERHRVTIWNSVPAIADLMLTAIGEQAGEQLASLRLVMLSGDWIPVSLPGRINAAVPDGRVISLGGATEASIWSIYYPIDQVEPDWTSIPYGTPLANQSFHVFDEHLLPCPIRTTGRLFIGGQGLAHSYWNDPGQTAERFIIHPDTGERLYDTGDLGRYRPDASIEFLGREDQQVKLRGFRIELGEIENALNEHPDVHSAVAVLHQTPEPRLVAYVVRGRTGEDDATLAPSERAAFTLQASTQSLIDDDAWAVALPGAAFEGDRRATFVARQSYRHFSSRPLSLDALGRWLGVLQAMRLDDTPLPKRRYPSAGGLYAVRAYLLVKDGAIEGLAGGAYRYDPQTHQLGHAGRGADGLALGFDAQNAKLASAAGLAVVLVAHMPAIRPLYGDWARDACLIEAGYASQALLDAGVALEIGGCPVGGYGDRIVRDALGLEDDDESLHVIVAGAIEAGQTQTWQPFRPALEAHGREPLSDTLRAWLLERLPDYMVPTSYVALDALPVTANGKVDRAALPAPDAAGRETRYVAPETPEAVLLCAIVAELLGVERVGLDDHFFHLGGHSLSATQLCARIRTELDRELPIRAVFETPGLADLAAALERLPASGSALVAGPRPERLPLSFPQARLWFLDRLEGGSPGYNIPIALQLSGPLDDEALDQALRDVVARHESLRTLLVDNGGEPRQQIVAVAEAGIALERRDSNQLEADVAAMTRLPFALDRELPIRAVLLRHDAAVHVLVIVVHHTAADGWSIRPLLADLSRAYAARRRGAVPAFDPLPVQYADYALWSRARFDEKRQPDDALGHTARYWCTQLDGLPDELALPYDGSRRLDAPAGHVTFTLPAQLHEALATLSRDSDATLFMTLQAGLAALLSRLGAGNDIPLGTAIAGRTDAVLEPLVGFFVNTLVLRNDLRGNPPFIDLIGRARSICLAAFAHQDLPFEHLVEQLEPARRRGRQPLFQTMLVLHNTPPIAVEFDGVAIDALEVAPVAAKFDLSFSLIERNSDDGRAVGIDAELEYNAALFDAVTVEALVARYVRLLTHVADRPDCRLDDLPLVAADECDRLLQVFGRGDEAVADVADVITLFEGRVHAAPGVVAVTSTDTRMTYAELDARSNRLARQLIEKGIGPERIVATELPRSVDLIVSLLAVLKAGATWLPLLPETPPARRRQLLDDAGPVLVLGTSDDGGNTSASVLDAHALINDDGPPPNPIDDSERAMPLHPQHAAYVLYTSGSTGMPKGVMISRGSLARYVGQVIGVLGEDSADMALLTPVVFDLSLTTIFAPLVTGGTLRLMPEDDTAAALASALQGTAVKLTPSHVALLAELPFETGRLETAILGGEALTAAHVETLRQRCPGVRIFNEYGPTEATVGVTAAVVDEPADITIGRPYPGVHAYVLDERLRPCPVNVAGELYLAGPSLARGYLNRPGLTAVHFIASPYRPGERLYRTGDLAAWRSDGELRCYGRNDEQIKLRGHRIEPAEIESTLARHPDVVNAVVIADKASNGETRLVAYVVSRAEFDTETLRAHLAMRLPDVFIPAVFVAVDALPLTPNGKLDRAALPVAADAGMSSNHGAPTSEDEQLLCELVAELLGVDRVGVDDHFFHLGGHSLLATRFVARIQEQTGKTLPLRAVFETPRLGDLAARLAMLGMPAPGDGARSGCGPGTRAVSADARAIGLLARPPGPRRVGSGRLPCLQ
ncbi:MAG: amino acid adenylation domain-containing protein [Gammaproteobacteria bacterium]|nr:amino acid adenylation domain-containing protein [Gammaproteobacteria bacterium]